ncbi:MAG TPA: PRC-barrel domain-containing protein [Burkholderiales bacterium]|nr:PRC-barrel domain-containing protein [Burkholderiales bacterium]
MLGLPDMLHQVRDLRGEAVVANDGEAGSLEDVVFENRRWVVRFFVVHTGGWLQGRLGGRRVLVSPAMLAADAPGRSVRVSMTRDELEHAPRQETAAPELCHAADLIGFDLESPDGAVGRVSDFLVDDQSWAIADVVVETSKEARSVLVPPSAVEGIDEAARKVRIRLSRDDLVNLSLHRRL